MSSNSGAIDSGEPPPRASRLAQAHSLAPASAPSQVESYGVAVRLVDHLSRPPQRQMLGDEVYEAIKSLIMSHVFEPGTRLNINALTRELDTSSTPVREALARLESDGLVTNVAMRGYTVSPVLDTRQVAELYQLRLLLEPWAAGQAATHADADDLTKLREELAGCPEPTDDGGYEAFRELCAHDARLHDMIFRIAGNETIRQAFARTHTHLHLFRLHYGGWATGKATLEEHAAIVEAIGNRDSRRTQAAMRRHLEAARDRILGPRKTR